MPKTCQCSVQGRGLDIRAKAKAVGSKAMAKLASRRLQAKAWPRGLHHWL